MQVTFELPIELVPVGSQFDYLKLTKDREGEYHNDFAKVCRLYSEKNAKESGLDTKKFVPVINRTLRFLPYGFIVRVVTFTSEKKEYGAYNALHAKYPDMVKRIDS